MIQQLLAALDERAIARNVASAHDEARMSFVLRRNTIDSFPEFARLLGEYFQHHFSACVAHGGRLSRAESEQRARGIIEQHYRKEGGDIVTAFNDAHEGTNGGLRKVLDVVADGLKEESVEHYVRGAFDRFILPSSWPDQVEAIRQFIAQSGFLLGRSIDATTPERYARNYQELIRAYVEGLQRSGRIFRRL